MNDNHTFVYSEVVPFPCKYLGYSHKTRVECTRSVTLLLPLSPFFLLGSFCGRFTLCHCQLLWLPQPSTENPELQWLFSIITVLFKLQTLKAILFVLRWSSIQRVLWALWVFRAWNLLSVALITSVLPLWMVRQRFPLLPASSLQVLPLLHNISWSSLQFHDSVLLQKKKKKKIETTDRPVL